MVVNGRLRYGLDLGSQWGRSAPPKALAVPDSAIWSYGVGGDSTHIVGGIGVGAAGRGWMVMEICARGPIHPVVVFCCATHRVMVVTVDVL